MIRRQVLNSTYILNKTPNDYKKRTLLTDLPTNFTSKKKSILFLFLFFRLYSYSQTRSLSTIESLKPWGQQSNSRTRSDPQVLYTKQRWINCFTAPKLKNLLFLLRKSDDWSRNSRLNGSDDGEEEPKHLTKNKGLCDA